MIKVCNLRQAKLVEPYDVRVDRTSILGNPFKMNGECNSQREYVCDLYHVYFEALVNNDKKWLDASLITQEFRESFMTELRRLYKIHKQYGQLNLYCWCAPKRCHAETIKAFLDKYLFAPKPCWECPCYGELPDCSCSKVCTPQVVGDEVIY